MLGIDLAGLNTYGDLQGGIEEPVPVPILRQGEILIAAIQSAPSDRDLEQLRDELSDRVGRFRSRGVVIDVTALDVLDSFASGTLRGIAHTTRLRGAKTVIVGIQPGVAFSTVQLGLTLDGVATALVLEEGSSLLRVPRDRGPHAG